MRQEISDIKSLNCRYRVRHHVLNPWEHHPLRRREVRYLSLGGKKLRPKSLDPTSNFVSPRGRVSEATDSKEH
jgi:hypothetical protein